MIPALAFVPPEQVEGVFQQLKEKLSGDEAYNELVKYFEDTYVGNSEGEKKAKFEINFWNVSARVKQGLPKTTNYVEAWHKRMSHAISCSHPTLGVLIDALKKRTKSQPF